MKKLLFIWSKGNWEAGRSIFITVRKVTTSRCELSAVIANCCRKPVSVSLSFIFSSAHLLSLSLIRSFLWNGDTTCVFAGRPKSAHQMSLSSSLALGGNMAHQPELWREPGSWVSSLHVVGDDKAVGGDGHIWQYLALLHPEPLLPSLGWEGGESPQLRLCQRALRAWGRGEGGRSELPGTRVQVVEYRMPFTFEWGFFSLFGFLGLFHFPTESSEILDGVLSCRVAAVAGLLLNHSNVNGYLITWTSSLVRWG